MRRGRKPLRTKHVDHLRGSPSAKERLAVILQTLEGELTIPEACARLGIGESRFHALRNQWLQEALALLEPRPLGRPPQEDDSADAEEAARLQQEVATLRDQLAAAEVRSEIAPLLPRIAARSAVKKKSRRRSSGP